MPAYDSIFTGAQVDEAIQKYFVIKNQNNSIWTPLANAGTSGQFLRGDGIWSNALTSDLIIDGNLSIGTLNTSYKLYVDGTSYFANTITGDALSSWHILANRPSNTTNFNTYFETAANLHHDTPARTDSELSYNRWYASHSDQTTYGPSALNLPVVDSHILSFGIDNGVAYSRHIAFDIRTNAIYTKARNNGTWTGWEQLVRNTGTWNINITGSSRYVQGDNNAANPDGALLRSGPGRADASPAGDTWIYFDQCSGVSSAWGIRHQQASNLIEFIGAGTVKTSINLSNGFVNTNSSYKLVKAAAGFSFDANTTARELSTSFTTHGRPVFLICSGDLNPTTADNAWLTVNLQRNGTTLCNQICEIHGNSWNNPFCICYLDVVAAGTYTYRAYITRGAGTFTLTEGGAAQSPNFVVFEI